MRLSRRWAHSLVLLLASLIIINLKFGLSILNPFHALWLLTHCSDYCDQYLAWEFFRNSPWSFPLGMIQNYPYPLESNVIFADPIPIFAFIFKPITRLFSGDFQYFGWWYLLCFFMMGYCAIGLLRNLGVSDKRLQLLGALFFVASPVLLYRTPHPALCAQWMIVACFWIYFDKSMSSKKKDILLFGLAALSVLTHPYLMPMILGLGVAYWAKASFLVNKRAWKTFIAKSMLASILVLFTMWIAGFFSVQSSEVGRSGFGQFSANLNTFFNSQDVSGFVPALPLVSNDQRGGFAYLGISIIFLFLIWIFDKFRKLPKIMLSKSNWPLIIVCCLLALYSLSDHWSINQFVFLQYTLPEAITKPFRVSGRFIWPLYFLIFAGTLSWWSKQKWNSNLKLFGLALFLILQIVEIGSLFKDKYIRHEYHSPFSSIVWEQIFSVPEKIIMYPPFKDSYQKECDRMDFVYFAHKYQKRITTGRIVYKENERLDQFKQTLNNKLAQADIEDFEADVFISTREHLETFKPLLEQNKVKGIIANGYLIFFPVSLIEKNEDLQQLSFETF